MPCDTETRRSAAMSASLITPGLTCGRRPVSRSTSAHIAARYSIVVLYPSRARARRAASYLQLRLVAEREQRLLAVRRLARAGDGQHLARGKIGGCDPARPAHEGAIAAGVAAKPGQRDEHLARIGDDIAMAEIAEPRGFRHERGQRRCGPAFNLTAGRRCRQQAGSLPIPVCNRLGRAAGPRLGVGVAAWPKSWRARNSIIPMGSMSPAHPGCADGARNSARKRWSSRQLDAAGAGGPGRGVIGSRI